MDGNQEKKGENLPVKHEVMTEPQKHDSGIEYKSMHKDGTEATHTPIKIFFVENVKNITDLFENETFLTNFPDLKELKGFGCPEYMEPQVHALTPVKYTLNYGFQQSSTCVCIEIHLPGIFSHPRSLISIIFEKRSFKLIVNNFLGCKIYFVHVKNLAHEICSENCIAIVITDKILLLLHKAVPCIWDSLFEFPPSVTTEFKKRLRNELLPFGLQYIANFEQILEDIRFESEKLHASGYRPGDVARFLNIWPPSKIQLPDHEIIISAKEKLCYEPFNTDVYVCVACCFLHETFQGQRLYNEPHREQAEEKDVEHEPPKGSCAQQLAQTLKEEGNKLFRVKKYAEAIEAYSEAIGMDCDCSSFFFNRAMAYFYLKDFYRCKKDVLKVIDMDPFNPKAHIWAAKVYTSLNRRIVAQEFLSVASFLNPRLPSVKKEFYNIRDLETCVSLYTKYVEDYDLAGILSVEMEYARLHCNCWSTLKEVSENLCQSKDIDNLKQLALVRKDEESYVFLKGTGPDWSNIRNDDRNYVLGLLAYYDLDEIKFRENFDKIIRLEDVDPDIVSRYEPMKHVIDLKKDGEEALLSNHKQKALSCYSKAFNIDSSPVIGSFFLRKKAEVKLLQGKRKEAIELLDSAVLKNSKCQFAFMMRGDCHLQNKMYSDAIADFKCAKAVDPRNGYYDFRLQLATAESMKQQQDCKVKRKPAQKQDTEKDKIDKAPRAELLKERGNKAFKAGNFDDAIGLYSDAIANDSSEPVYFSNRAACYIMLRKFSEALKDIELAVKLDDTFSKGHFRMGRCLLALGDTDAALESFSKVQKLDPSNKDAAQEIEKMHHVKLQLDEGEKYLVQKRYQEGFESFSSALNIAEASKYIISKAAECLLCQNKSSDAYELLENAPEEVRISADGQLIYALLCYYEDFDEGEEDVFKYLNKALKVDPTHVNTRQWKQRITALYQKKKQGTKAYEMHNFDLAEKLFTEAIAIDSTHVGLLPKLHFNVGMAQMRQNKLQEAVASFTVTLEYKMHPKALRNRAKCYVLLNDYQKANNDFLMKNSFITGKAMNR